MTIVLDCLTRKTVFQVSDRRLVDLKQPAVPVDDETNKAVIVNGRVVFGYTGLSQILGEHTDEWLARVIMEGPIEDMAVVASRIKEEATVAFRQMHCEPGYKRHAFRGTGWFRLRGETNLSPGLITIHNAFDHVTGDWLHEPLEEFRVAHDFPTMLPGGCLLRHVGVTPTAGERSAIVRLVRKCAKRTDAPARAVLMALVMAVRWLSIQQRYTPIGSRVMAVALPRLAVEKFERTEQFEMSGGRPLADMPTFCYFPRGADGRWMTFQPIIIVGSPFLTGPPVRVVARPIPPRT